MKMESDVLFTNAIDMDALSKKIPRNELIDI
jgi:hypothetical protein